MPPTDEQRENRALMRLRREEGGLRTPQLHTVGVNNAAIERLADEGWIEPGPLGCWQLTLAGRCELDARYLMSRYSTCG
jgi:hypothetical protein